MKDFNSSYSWAIKLLIAFITLQTHIIVLVIPLGQKLDLNIWKDKKVSIKLKPSQKVREIGKEDSQHKKIADIPSQKQDGLDVLKQFAISQKQGTSDKPPKKEEIVKPSKRARVAKKVQQINYAQRQIMQEAVKAKREENPLLNQVTDYNVKFVPPKGISPDQLNEFEKVFYSFFRRVAIKYITSIQSTVLDAVDEKPYIQNTLRNHGADVLTARIVYDSDGNAEKITILKSSEDDEVHEIFEKALRKMTKIPNVAKELKDENGKYTAYFQLGINQRSRN
ncbi:hypothetical protein [Bacteriovorax sp. DB6_IX]|uniref:hypothetical protein n=1 Tax=Bacteriovorax sp. DB6_IX TaxID=1353530 RepID=UPI000389F314|nr:hypothetical protein [Bacteriovorax sp. DB6_IX]EQC50560.1 hypothetical protein M901_2324 [Bacteriovorax sp. DB6_IX]